MKRFLWIFLCAGLLTTSCHSSSKKNEEDNNERTDTSTTVEQTQQLAEIITRFGRAYISQDNQKANALIHPDLGLYIIYRPGVADVYKHVDSIDFSRPVPQHFPYTTFENDYVLTFEKLPIYDCGTERWDKLGFYADTTANADQLTKIVSFRQEFENTTAAEVARIQEVEKETYRVILTVDENLIFHVKRYEGSWYVIVLDRAYGWCDA